MMGGGLYCSQRREGRQWRSALMKTLVGVSLYCVQIYELGRERYSGGHQLCVSSRMPLSLGGALFPVQDSAEPLHPKPSCFSAASHCIQSAKALRSLLTAAAALLHFTPGTAASRKGRSCLLH
ncbi:hypothetical protein NDU88_005934 [Pleurodeles waltl]|uniref:Uncharacterized protein n=1 Tax=Pleurodeles waltl TaxID=8319 RepID=A0AAV7MCN9_PLEWA|nr:hypothetical protein NDU88_005934 [Pleurodeles waltl]